MVAEVNRQKKAVFIRMDLDKNSHNQVLVAKLLGISRNALRERLERYKISIS